MKILRIAVWASLLLAFASIYTFAQESPATDTVISLGGGKVRVLDQIIKDDPNSEIVLSSISSTATGGLWSSPSTWEGGVVPGSGDNVTIVSGSAVLIDTAASAGALTVGSGGSPAVLTFEPSSAHSLTVAGDLNILGAIDILATPSVGTVTTHLISVGGNLTNNGVLDLSTNADLAGADLVFTGASSNTFGGGGSITDIRTITMNKGTSNANVLELMPSNFTVRGSTTDTTDSGYLTLNNGTFKISGTFTGSHRMIPTVPDPQTATMQQVIPATSGIWLNNTNFTFVSILDQYGNVRLKGLLRISAGTFNVGDNTGSQLIQLDRAGNPVMIVEGGNVNVSGGISPYWHSGPFNPPAYIQSGGKVTICKGINHGGCFSMENVTLSGGEIVVQNAAEPVPPPGSNSTDFVLSGTIVIAGTTLRFGNADSTLTGTFRAGTKLPNVIIDTTNGPQRLKVNLGNSLTKTEIGNINIGPNAVLDMGNGSVWFKGDTNVNNGIIDNTTPFPTDPKFRWLEFFGTGTNADVTFLGTGTVAGKLGGLGATCRSITFGPGMGNLPVAKVELHGTQLINSSKIAFDSLANIAIYDDGKFDSTPVFDAAAASAASYTIYGAHTIGPEIPSNRTISSLTAPLIGPLTLEGGDLTVIGTLSLSSAALSTGTNKVIVKGFAQGSSPGGQYQGWVDGTMVHPFTTSGSEFNFPVGQNFASWVWVSNVTFASPASLAVKAVDAALPGLPAGTSASRYWKLETTGNLSGRLQVRYRAPDVQGNPANYRLWRSVGGGPPVLCPGSGADINGMTVTCLNIPDLSGDWGIAEWVDPGPISISGRVSAASGVGIRNALVILSGGNLPAPITVQTGNLGTYGFQNIPAGQPYTITVAAKRYRFASTEMSILPLGSLTNVDFVANPQD